MRVLVVDDEPAISAALERGLLAEGLDVDVAADGESALWRAREGDYGVIILDILLPDRSGYEVCEILRGERIATPILMLTAKSGGNRSDPPRDQTSFERKRLIDSGQLA